MSQRLVVLHIQGRSGQEIGNSTESQKPALTHHTDRRHPLYTMFCKKRKHTAPSHLSTRHLSDHGTKLLISTPPPPTSFSTYKIYSTDTHHQQRSLGGAGQSGQHWPWLARTSSHRQRSKGEPRNHWPPTKNSKAGCKMNRRLLYTTSHQKKGKSGDYWEH